MDPSLVLVIGVFVFVLYLDHLRFSLLAWQHFRDPRSLRGWVVSLVLALGTFAIVLGRAAILWPQLRVLSLFLGTVISGALIVVGIFLAWSWRQRPPPSA